MWQNLCIIIDGLVQERRNSIANTLELHLSCTNPSIRWCARFEILLSDHGGCLVRTVRKLIHWLLKKKHEVKSTEKKLCFISLVVTCWCHVLINNAPRLSVVTINIDLIWILDITCIGIWLSHFNKVWWLCLVPTSTTRFASDVGYRMAKI